MKYKTITLLILVSLKSFSQSINCRNIYNPIFCEEFQNLYNWQGEKNKFTIENNKLKSNDIGAGESYLSLPYSLDTNNNIIWNFNLELNFNTSSNNFTDIYLIGDSLNPIKSQNAIILRIGHDSKDRIRLAKKINGKSRLNYFISIDNKVLNNANNNINFKVIYKENEGWTLEVKINNNKFLGKSEESLHLKEGFFSIKNKYTKTNKEKIFLSDLFLSYIKDVENINCENLNKTILCDEFINLDNKWEGDTNNFKIENNKLKLDDNKNGESFISKKYINRLPKGEIKWSFDLDLNFNPSSGNISEVYLISDSLNPKKSQNAFFLKIGDGDDWIRLSRKKNGTNRYFISSERKILDNSYNKLKVEVVLDKNSNWTMNFILNNTIIFSDNGDEELHIREGYFSFYNKYNSGGLSGGFFMDNLYTQLLDNEKPKIEKIAIKNSNTIRIIFSEEIEISTTKNINNFILENFGNPKDIIYLYNKIDLIYDSELTTGEILNFKIENIEDLSQNKMDNYSEKIFMKIEGKYNILINEFMPNPSPPIYLPNAEYIELYNAENSTIDIKNWSLNIYGKKYIINKSILIPPKEYIILVKDKEYYNLFESEINKVLLEELPDIPNISESTKNYISTL